MYSEHGQRRVLVALAASILAAAGVTTASAAADTCPNAQFRIGPSAHLADCRAYEQVSPAEKNGADAIATGSAGLSPVRASSADGEGSPSSSVVYTSVASYTGSLGSGLPNPHLSSRTAEGWRTISLAPPTPQATPPGGYFLGYDFSPDLSQFVLRDALQNPLAPGAQPEPPRGVYNLYVHHPDGSYTLVTTAPPTTSAPEECSVCLRETDMASFAGASSDFSHVIFETNESLTPGAPPATEESLYESSGGVVRLVGVLPDGTIAAGGSQAGAGASIYYSSVNLTATYDINHAISADGSNVFFEAAADGGEPDSAQSGLTELYDRVGGSSTKEISAPAPGTAPANGTPEPARFWAASADGSLVFFTSSAELTTQSNTGAGNAGPDLYRYDVGSDSLADLTIDTNPLDAGSGANVLGVVGASEDGSYVYFVATGQLLPGKGVDGQLNLYLAHAGQLAFIATLDGKRDTHDWTSVPGELQAYVTPDGRHLAFMSASDRIGYDNRDQASGLADSEVYEYSADSGALVCASCNPGGAGPQGNAFIGGEFEAWVSTPFYQPRALNEDGSRLFFSSPSPLAPGASDSHTKVYEYENGAIHLISSGTSESDDFFLDASPSGNDVFFATRQPLLPSDQDNLVNIYDARIDGGFPPATAPAACAGSTCQGLPSAPPALPSAISGSFAGAGNILTPATAPAKAHAKKVKAKKQKKKPSKRRTGKRGRAAGSKARHARTRAGRART